MNLALWTSWQTRCGIAAYSAALAEELRRRGVAVDVVPVPYAERAPAALDAMLERLNTADLVHLQHEYTFFGGIAPRASSLPRLLAGLRKPHVVTAHTVFTAAELLRVDTETRPRKRIAKRLLAALPTYRRSVEQAPFAAAAAVIVHTEAARKRMTSRGIPAGRVHVLPAGIPARSETGGDPDDARALRERLGLGDARVVSIFGYVTADKGYEVALRALRALPPAVHLVIAGGTRVEHERAYMEALREEIRRLGLTRRVSITGYLEEPELAAVMALSELVLVPHTAANGSYSVMVALGYEKAVVASDLPCFRELRDTHRCVDLFDAGDEAMLAERVGFLLASRSARRELETRARAFAEARSWSAVAARTLEIYAAAKGAG